MSKLSIIALFAILAMPGSGYGRDTIRKGDVVVVPLQGEISPSLLMFLRRAEKLARKSAPFEIEKRPKAHWVEPKLLADVEYRRMTKKRKLLRHPSFKGLREDLID